MVRAEGYVSNMAAFARRLGTQMGVEGLHLFGAVQPLADAALIGDDEAGNARPVPDRQRFGRTADASAFNTLEQRVGTLAVAVEGKMNLSEGQAALANKLEKSVGEQTISEVEGLQTRVGQLHARAPHATLYMDAGHGGWLGWPEQADHFAHVIRELPGCVAPPLARPRRLVLCALTLGFSPQAVYSL